jgi:hypothetical protein
MIENVGMNEISESARNLAASLTPQMKEKYEAQARELVP